MFLIIAVWIFIHTPFGQNWIAGQVTKRFSRDLQTKITIKHVDFSLFNRMHLVGVLIGDRSRDTLLYAGDLKVRITDWFFFKKNIELKYVGLDDALIKFQRTDSVWSQQFLFDYFSSPSGDSKSKEGIRLNLKKTELKNVTLIKKDAWLGEDVTIHLTALNLDANEINFSKKIVEASSLTIDQPFVSISNYKKNKPPTAKKDSVKNNAVDSLLIWNEAGWAMHLDKLEIRNGVFKTDKQSGKPLHTLFDGKHIEFDSINAGLTNIRWNKDTITTQLDLKTKEQSGFEVKKLLADVKLTPREMAFNELDITTNKSTIRNYFRMSYDDFSDMGDFIHKIKMQANFAGSEINSDDIAFFAPGMKNWKKKISVKGRVRGTVDDLMGKEMLVQAGNSTLLNGDISLTGLPDINQTFIDFKANDFRTTYSDAVTILPVLHRVTFPDLYKIQYISFTGSFTGFIRDFVTFGTIKTNLGTVKSDLNMKLPRGKEPLYSGNISTDNFKLGEFLNDPKIGAIAMTGVIKGKGFSDKTRNVMLDGTVNFVDYNNYRYNNITVKGKLDKYLFDGFASINDENADLTMNGIIDFNSKTPKFDFIADTRKANLKKLNLTDNDLAFKGRFNLDFSGSNIDNFIGTARISDAELTKNGDRLPLDSLILSSSIVNNEKVLSVSSNEFTGTINGDFNIYDLPNAFQLFLNKYYPAYVKPPDRYPKNESFHFDITTQFAEDFIKLADSSLSGFNYSHLYGDLNSGLNEMNLTADIPQFKFNNYSFDNIKLLAQGNFDSLSLTGLANNIIINDSLNIPQAIFKVSAHNDSSYVSIVTGANQKVEKANLNALVLTYDDGVKIEFDPSTFSINGKTWYIDENGELEFRRSNPASGQLVLREGEQKIMLKTQPSVTGNWNDLKVELTKVNIGDLSPYFLSKNRLEGLLSGNFMVEDPLHSLKIISDDIKTEFLRLDNDSLGEIKASLVYDNVSKELKVNGSTVNQDNYLGFNADLFFGDPMKQKNNSIALSPRNFQIKILERFLGDLFSDMQGWLTGNIDIKGEFDQLEITGKGRLKDAGLKVNFTQCFYKIQDTDVELSPGEINLNGLVLTDPVTTNQIYVNGNIQHTSFNNMFYDLYISTRKPNTTGEGNNRPVLLLNTSFKDNKQFYGRAKGTGSLSLTGPQSEMFMKIDAIASTRDSSNITITSTSSRESGMADFLVERKYGYEMSDSGFKKNAANILYDVDVTANRMVSARVVLDELTGDEIKGKGSGTLNIKSGTTEPLSIRGRYDIEEGNYLFTFQSFFKKPFELKRENNNYIEWSGDPYDAKINIVATYTATNVSFAPLAISLKNLDQNISRARGDVYVVAKLTDRLFKPHIDFSLEFPPSSVVNNDPALAFSLQQLQKNTNELNKQATYLVVFGIFAPVENVGTTSIGDIATNSLSGIFFSIINEQVKKIVSSIFKTEKYNFTFSSSLYNRNVIDAGSKFNLGSNINASLGRSFFRNRLILTVGGSVEGVVQSGVIQQQVGFLKDFSMEVLINQSGTFRANLFYRENIDYLTTNPSGAGRMKRAGVGISFRKEFDKLGDLFRKKKISKPVAKEKTVTKG